MKIQASEIRKGDFLDLAGDPFVDPRCDRAEFQFEYMEVVSVEQECSGCIAIGFEGFDVVGFPPEHMLTVHAKAD
ncbi:MAG: hypothetical protein IH852_09185 [Bacteroidetes bacterium]|nr:hypothetical protein [Bacteroidota bacterium]